VLVRRAARPSARALPPWCAAATGGPRVRPAPTRSRQSEGDSRRRRGDLDVPRVRAARVLDAARWQRGVEAGGPRSRLGHGLRGRSERGRGLHRLPATQDRPAVRDAADPHGPRRRISALRERRRELTVRLGSVRLRVTLAATSLFAIALALASFALVR